MTAAISGSTKSRSKAIQRIARAETLDVGIADLALSGFCAHMRNRFSREEPMADSRAARSARRDLTIAVRAAASLSARLEGKADSYLDFTSIDFSSINLASIDLTRADLSNTVWVGSRLLDIDFSWCTFNGVDLECTRFIRCTFDSARMTETMSFGASYIGCDFGDAIVQDSSFEHSFFDRTSMNSTTIKGSSFRGSTMEKTTWVSSQLDSVDFSMADLSDTVMAGSTLRGSRFDLASLQGADLSGADLNGASLRYSDCEGTSFSRTDLTLADLYMADMRKVDLRDALNVKKEQTDEVVIDSTTMLPNLID